MLRSRGKGTRAAAYWVGDHVRGGAGVAVALSTGVGAGPAPPKNGLTKPRLKHQVLSGEQHTGTRKPFSALVIGSGSGIQSGRNGGAVRRVEEF